MKQLKFLTSAFIAVVLLGCSVFPAFAQQTSGDHPTAQAAFDPHYYHLVFVVKEVEAGSVINSRSYFMTIGTVDGSANTHNARSIRTGSRIPAEYEPGKIDYLDVGVSIDCRSLVDLGPRIAMDLSADISSLQTEAGDTKAPHPSIQQNKWNSQVVVVLGKPTVVFSSDEVTSNEPSNWN